MTEQTFIPAVPRRKGDSGKVRGMIKGHSAMSAGFFGSHNWGEGMLPAFSGLRPGMLVNTLQHAGQPHDRQLSSPKCQQC